MVKAESVTLWYKKIQIEVGPGDIKEEWEFNHLEDGHVDIQQRRPLPIKPEFKEQAKEWKHGIWGKVSGCLLDGEVIKVSYLVVVEEGENGKLKFINIDEME